MSPQSPFYLGRIFDPAQGKVTDQPLSYDPDDLTTHAVVTGMTGSGKTGLCIDLLEEAALNGIPAILIDPKGDLTNLLLHFPGLSPAEFQPWLDADAVRRQGKTLEVVAEETAARWQAGLAEWGLGPERIAALQQAAEFAVYTPGSDSGKQVSILASLQAPSIPWEGNREILREKISATVTALLGIMGLSDIDPVRSREHILLSNIFEAAWSQGKSLDLGELILQTQSPPFSKLGVFPVENFFPEKDRLGLAMLLNNFLAAPAFQTWMEGQPLDIPALLYTADGRPRHSVFYLAHLSDAERMFFVTLLISSFETWMRTQSGSSSLRAILYFDELVGYLPPVSNPPSKMILLRMLKQARAFGVGLLLASQNPVDVDYKALSNAGTWFIGKLQTEQDKQRLLDGLSGAGGGIDSAEYSRLISGLGKRVFLLHNVHSSQPVLFQTRWTLNYLAGPLTRAQIPALNRLAATASSISYAQTRGQAVQPGPVPPVVTAPASPGSSQVAVPAAVSVPVPPLRPAAPPPAPAYNGAAASQAPESPAAPDDDAQPGTTTRPAVPASVSEYFMPNNRTLAQALQVEGRVLAEGTPPAAYLYRPALVAQARIRFLARKYGIETEQVRTALALNLDRRGVVRWDENQAEALDPQLIQLNGLSQARFDTLGAPLGDTRILAALQKDFLDWAYRTSQLRLRANESLAVYALPEVSTGAFRDQCSQAARAGRDDEIDKINASFDTKEAGFREKLSREQREMQQDEQEYNERKMEEFGTGVENIIGLFSKSRRRLSTSLTKHRLTEQAKGEVDESRQVIKGLQDQLTELEKERQQALQQANDRWAQLVDDISEVPLTPQKKDVFLDLFGVIWLPHYVLRSGSETIILSAFN